MQLWVLLVFHPCRAVILFEEGGAITKQNRILLFGSNPDMAVAQSLSLPRLPEIGRRQIFKMTKELVLKF